MDMEAWKLWQGDFYTEETGSEVIIWDNCQIGLEGYKDKEKCENHYV